MTAVPEPSDARLTPEFDDGTRWEVDTDVIGGWRGDFDRIDGERLLRSVPNPPEPPDEAWRQVTWQVPDA